MKKCIIGLLVLLTAFSFSTVAPYSAMADESQSKVEQAVDVFDDVNGKVSDVTDAVYDAVASAATDEKALSTLMNGLEKVGIKGGWAKKLGELNKIKGVTNAFSKAVTVLNAGKTLGELSAAYQSGDKEAFRNIVADQLTSLAAGLVGKAVGAAIHAVGGAIITASALTGPGFIIASGVVLVADWVVSGWVEGKIEEAMKDGSMYQTFQQFGDMIWDMIGKLQRGDDPGNGQVCLPGDDPGGEHPGFEMPPENGDTNQGGDNRYQGLKALRLID